MSSFFRVSSFSSVISKINILKFLFEVSYSASSSVADVTDHASCNRGTFKYGHRVHDKSSIYKGSLLVNLDKDIERRSQCCMALFSGNKSHLGQVIEMRKVYQLYLKSSRLTSVLIEKMDELDGQLRDLPIHHERAQLWFRLKLALGYDMAMPIKSRVDIILADLKVFLGFEVNQVDVVRSCLGRYWMCGHVDDYDKITSQLRGALKGLRSQLEFVICNNQTLASGVVVDQRIKEYIFSLVAKVEKQVHAVIKMPAPPSARNSLLF